jgi:hypothetical protein
MWDQEVVDPPTQGDDSHTRQSVGGPRGKPKGKASAGAKAKAKPKAKATAKPKVRSKLNSDYTSRDVAAVTYTRCVTHTMTLHFTDVQAEGASQ